MTLLHSWRLMCGITIFQAISGSIFCHNGFFYTWLIGVFLSQCCSSNSSCVQHVLCTVTYRMVSYYFYDMWLLSVLLRVLRMLVELLLLSSSASHCALCVYWASADGGCECTGTVQSDPETYLYSTCRGQSESPNTRLHTQRRRTQKLQQPNIPVLVNES